MVSMTLLAYEEDKRNRSVVRTLKCPILIEKCIIHLFKFDMKKILFPMPCLPFAYFFLHFSIICSILLTFLKRNYVQAFYSDWLYQKFFEKVSNITNHCSRPVVIQPISVECLHIGSMQAFYTDWLYLAMDFLSQYNQSLQNAFTYLVHKHSTVIGYIRISQIEYFCAELPDI